MSNTSEWFSQWLKIEVAARELLPAEAKKQLADRQYNRSDVWDGRLNTIDEKGITFAFEYNDSCHCHPECSTAYVTVSWDAIEMKLEAKS
jgi:hypothetical protein